MNPMLLQMQAWFGPNARMIRSLAVPLLGPFVPE